MTTQSSTAGDGLLPVDVVKRFRHVKRGTTYEVVGEAELQMSADLVDGSDLIIYRGEDGKMWAREAGEFNDGRFEPLPDHIRTRPTPAAEAREAIDAAKVRILHALDTIPAYASLIADDVRLVLTSRPDVASVGSEVGRYYPKPWRYDDSHQTGSGEWPALLDANGATIATFFWPAHPVEETAAAEQDVASLANALISLTAAPSESVGDWVLVPREPTSDMIDAGDDCYGVARGTESWVIGGCKGSEKIWAAMLTAAPKSGEPTQRVSDGGVLREALSAVMSALGKVTVPHGHPMIAAAKLARAALATTNGGEIAGVERLQVALDPFAQAARRINRYDGEQYDAPLYAMRTGGALRELLNGEEGEPLTVGTLRAALSALAPAAEKE